MGHSPTQTSAHAEMDLRGEFAARAHLPNLRSRGDGPDVCGGGFMARDKPPLTRRWTPHRLLSRRHRRQTSAHAEMDPCEPSATCRRSPNLRSRGDGPEKDTFDIQWKYKPPLTRRWTRVLVRGWLTGLQTSAHAEMDLSGGGGASGQHPNLRSRGDGPRILDSLPDWERKPPLTRRWTSPTVRTSRSMLQTSAHAEMDPAETWFRP